MIRASILSDFAADPWYNMAADEYLLLEASRDSEAIFVRLYTWLPGAITFGYNQSLERAVRSEAVGQTPLIRRVTGGRALYHDPSELTYAIAFNQSPTIMERLGWTIAATQSQVAAVLAEFLRRGGIATHYSRVEGPREHDRSFAQSAPCFASTGRYELMGEAGKVAASAQRRVGGAVLQHGSIKLDGLAAHPALLVNPSRDIGTATSAMNDNSFRRHLKVFADAFRAITGVAATFRGYSSSEKVGITMWREVVRKKPIERRDIFKHSPIEVSL